MSTEPEPTQRDNEHREQVEAVKKWGPRLARVLLLLVVILGVVTWRFAEHLEQNTDGLRAVVHGQTLLLHEQAGTRKVTGEPISTRSSSCAAMKPSMSGAATLASYGLAKSPGNHGTTLASWPPGRPPPVRPGLFVSHHSSTATVAWSRTRMFEA